MGTLISKQRAGNTGSESLLASAARTASGTGATTISPPCAHAQIILFELNVTAQSGTGPTLDVVVQASMDSGTTWFNVARFSQTGAATGRKMLKVHATEPFATEIVPETSPAVGTGLLVSNSMWDDTLRVAWTIGGTTPSYTFSVVALPLYST